MTKKVMAKAVEKTDFGPIHPNPKQKKRAHKATGIVRRPIINADQTKAIEQASPKGIETLSDQMILVGEITGAHGIKGFVKVESLSDFAELRFAAGKEIFVEKLHRALKIQQSQMHKGLYLLKLTGIEDRDQAHSLLHTYLKIFQQEVAPLPEGEYYHFQLIGLEVFEGEAHWGTLTDVRQTGSNDVYTIKTVDGAYGGEILLPALKTVVLRIDLAENKMHIQMPTGLLD